MQNGSVLRVIVPTGGTEQNGAALPLGKHNAVVRYTAQQIAAELGGTLIAPVLAYVPEGRISPTEGHMRFAGTLSVDDDTFAATLEATARSLKQHGFKRIYLMGDSGGNQAMQERVAQQLSSEWASQNILVASLSDYYGRNGQAEWAAAHYPAIKDPTGHAGFVNVAEVLAVGGISDTRLQAAFLPYQEQFAGLSAAQITERITKAGEALLRLKIEAALQQIRRIETGAAND